MPHSGPYWMMVLIDVDPDPSTGWLGYDYGVNEEVLKVKKQRLNAGITALCHQYPSPQSSGLNYPCK